MVAFHSFEIGGFRDIEPIILNVVHCPLENIYFFVFIAVFVIHRIKSYFYSLSSESSSKNIGIQNERDNYLLISDAKKEEKKKIEKWKRKNKARQIDRNYSTETYLSNRIASILDDYPIWSLTKNQN